MTTEGKTVARLLAVKQRKVNAAEAAHVVAHRATREASLTHAAAEARWMAAVDADLAIGAGPDRETRLDHVGMLAQAVVRAERDLHVRLHLEAEKRQTMLELRTELRRFESWLAATAEVRRLEARRRARAEAPPPRLRQRAS